MKQFLTLITLLTVFMTNTYSQGGNSIKGKVVTSDGKPAAMVTVQLKGSGKNALTRTDGTFLLRNVEAGNYTLEVSLVGYQTVEQPVTVSTGEITAVAIRLSISEKQLDQVTVLGTNKFRSGSSDYVNKMPLERLENPQVYTTISKELMQEQMVFTADDAMKTATGAYKLWDNFSRPGYGGSFFTLRGFATQSKLRNGVAGYTSSIIDGSNIEKIEVIKGPSAALFGSSLTSYGGLINRVTKKPYDHTGGEVSYATGSYGLNRLSVDVNAPVNKDKSMAFRLNGAYQSEGSFQNVGNSKSLFLAPSLSYQVNDRLSFLLETEYRHTNGTTPFLMYMYYGTPMSAFGVSSADQIDIDYKRNFVSDDVRQQADAFNVFGQMNYKISDKWLSQTNLAMTTNRTQGPANYYYLLPDAMVTGDPSAVGAHYMARMVWEPTGDDRTMELQQNFIGDFTIGNHRNRITAGLDYFHYNIDLVYRSFIGSPAGVGLSSSDLFDVIPINGNIPAVTNFNLNKIDSAYASSPAASPYIQDNQTNTYSAYFSDVFNVTDQLMALVSLRLDHFVNEGSYDAASNTTYGDYNQTQLSPKFGLVYQVVKDRVALFGNYQNGFTNKTGTDYKGDVFKPEQANQWEGGVKLDVFNGKLSSTISYYDIKVKDIVRTYQADPNFSIQDGTQVSKGLEAEVVANPVAGLNIMVGYAYNDSKYEQAEADVEGLRPGTAGPKNQANLWMSYRFPATALKGWGVGFGGNYADAVDEINSRSQGTFTLPSYTVLNATVFYDQPKFRVGLKVNNLTNKHYWIGWTTINPQMLRQVVGSISFKF